MQKEIMTKQFWCYTDTEYANAKKIQSQVDTADPNHEHLAHVVVIDCREIH